MYVFISVFRIRLLDETWACVAPLAFIGIADLAHSMFVIR